MLPCVNFNVRPFAFSTATRTDEFPPDNQVGAFAGFRAGFIPDREFFSEAFQRNPEFYSFYRSMEAYRQSLRSKADVMVLDPSSDFFKYLKSPGRGNKSSGQ